MRYLFIHLLFFSILLLCRPQSGQTNDNILGYNWVISQSYSFLRFKGGYHISQKFYPFNLYQRYRGIFS